MRPANERRRYIVTSSLIGWAHAKMIPELLLLSHVDGAINGMYYLTAYYQL